MTGLSIRADGSIQRDGVRVGGIIRRAHIVPQFINGRPIGECPVHGWALDEANGTELFWSPVWGHTKAHAVQFLGGVQHKLAVAA